MLRINKNIQFNISEILIKLFKLCMPLNCIIHRFFSQFFVKQVMKPGSRPYDRNSKEWQTMETANPCNDFLVQFLVRSKIKVDKQGLNQYYCYNLAIQSVKKYPLPILCPSQLAVIEGFGDFFKTETMKLIKKHYTRSKLPTAQQKKQDQAQQNESLRLNIKKINAKKSEKRNKKVYRSDSQDLDEYENPQVPEDINMFQSQIDSRFDGTSNFSKMSSKSSKMLSGQSQNSQNSLSSQSTRAYKPKPGTQPFQILQIMKSLNAHKKPITKGEINQYLYDKSQQKMKLWHLTRSKLRDHGFIKIDDDDNDFLHLTQKGLIYVDGCTNKDDTTTSKTKKEEDQESNYQVEHRIFKKIPVPPPLNYKDLTLIINTSTLTEEERQIVDSHFTSIKGLKYKLQRFDVCSFIWQIEDNILDVAIARVKLSELNQYDFKNLCYCLKATQSKQIILFLQLSEEQGGKLSQQDKQRIQILVTKAKITKIKTYRTKNLKQTLIGLQKLRKIFLQILKNIINGSQIMSLGTLSDFNDRNQRKNPLILRNIFISSLRTFPCISIKNIKGIVQRLPCFKLMYDKMSELQGENQRVQFLSWILKKHRSRAGTNRMLVDFMFLPNYNQEV